ncbi:MAG: 50S ribosomal protein L4 [Candidatus Odinarchaeum yellowstonii]|uniref:Large ribosomal subunit protein uL4 n=1 Tax=Odinarchaeota yellowstonii (strain LCB_4) TaxID=1841599 RepID=A0AAF0D3K3_ODILC|nr:MAG: 50S ribosomal protein L4 [Candidatus Odinarchaeum yellowstonii]
MKVGVYSLKGRKIAEVELPPVFKTPVRLDLIKRAVLSAISKRRQPYGRDPMAGKRTTAISLGPGHGISRAPRIKGSGYSAAQRGAFSPSTVGGRLAHPPRSNKVIGEKINVKERRLAIKSAIACTAIKELVEARGHKITGIKELPIIVDEAIEKVNSTKEAIEALQALGLEEELERCKENIHMRSGRGKTRGRRYKKPRGPLIVIAKDEGIVAAVKNIPGVDIINVKNLNCELLAPGCHPGRLTVYSKSALETLKNR